MRGINWIDQLKEELAIDSDYAIAKVLNVYPSAIAAQRNGRAKTLDDDTAMTVAELLEVDPMQIIADQNAERGKTARVKNYWRTKMAGRINVRLLVVIILGVLTVQHTAISSYISKTWNAHLQTGIPSNIYYVKLNNNSEIIHAKDNQPAALSKNASTRSLNAL